MQVLKQPERHRVRFVLNGQQVEGLAEPRMLLTDFIRHEIGATGTRVGCEHGICGACTIRVNGLAVRACLMLAVQADGQTLDTVEGLAQQMTERCRCYRQPFTATLLCNAAIARQAS